MADILGVGLSHYPGPLVPAKDWPRMLKRNVDIGRVKPDVFADRSRWPKPMQAEWGGDDGVAAAREHEARLLAGYRVLRRAIDEFKPDLVIVWGDDQFENFRKDCVPPFCVYIFDQVVCRPYGGGRRPFHTEDNAWGLPNETELVIKGHRDAAAGLARYLLEHDFDISYAHEVRAESGLAHSFNNTVVFLDRERRGFPYPVIPFHVNCYGNQLMETAAGARGQGMAGRSPPAPSPRRCFEIGRATARYFKESPWRAVLIGSSSWSHGSLTAKHGRLYPDLAADRALYDDLAAGRMARWGDIPLADIEDAGQHEVLNWVCLAGAMSELGQKPEIVDYVETYLFNSSKCFALFPPAGAGSATAMGAGTRAAARAAP